MACYLINSHERQQDLMTFQPKARITISAYATQRAYEMGESRAVNPTLPLKKMPNSLVKTRHREMSWQAADFCSGLYWNNFFPGPTTCWPWSTEPSRPLGDFDCGASRLPVMVVMIALLALGLEWLMAKGAVVLDWIRYVGAAYLLWMGGAPVRQ